MRRAFVLTVSTALLATAACEKNEPDMQPTRNPPAPNPDPVPEPAPDPVATGSEGGNGQQVAGLPKWDDVPSGHPEGATNPPSPYLIVSPNGDCYKKWEGGMIPGGPDRVETDCSDGKCGTQIQCPDGEAEKLLEAWKADGGKQQ